MQILFSKEFGIDSKFLERAGVFDALIDGDSKFFINLKLLQSTTVPEFVGAYDKINDYFRKIGLLLQNATIGDRLYKRAFELFNFPEVNGINLGFSSGNHGAGFGKELRLQIIKDAYKIIHGGSTQPEIFHLVGLFEDNVGPDRISDMIARLVFPNIIEYTKRIYKELLITPEKYPHHRFKNGIVMNPYKRNTDILLLPSEILNELPIARCWDDIERVCRENEAIKREINEVVAAEWHKISSTERKAYLKEHLFKNPEGLARVIESYRSARVEKCDFTADVEYVVGCLRSDYKVPVDSSSTSMEATIKILSEYKKWIEENKGSFVINESKSRHMEKIVQRTIHAVALMYCKEHNWDISPESDSGRGPVDFKISRGIDKTVVEIKLTSNQQCVHGLEVQIEQYALAEETNKKVFVLVDTGVGTFRIHDVLKKHEEMVENGKHPADIIVIDAKPKASASAF